MKKYFFSAARICAGCFAFHFAQNSSAAPPVVAEPWHVTERAAHSRVWESVELVADPVTGRVTPRKHSYVEMATGMHRWENGGYVEASPVIELTQTGQAIARLAQHQIIFPTDIAADIVDLLAVDDQRFQSRILGLAFYDSVSGQSALFAELKSTVGQLSPSGTELTYPNAFGDDVPGIDVVYRNALASFEQDLVVRQKGNFPSPTDYGLPEESARILLLTEFFAPPIPTITRHVIRAEEDPIRRQAMADPDFADEVLNFGVTVIPQGRAFTIGRQAGEASVVVGKSCDFNLEYTNLDLVKITDRMNHVYQFSYDAIRRLTKSIAPEQQTNTYIYCECGSAHTFTDAAGRVTTLDYDLNGRLTNAVYPGDYVVRRSYDQVGRLTRVSDSSGYAQTNWFSNQGLLVAASNAVGQVFCAIYDHRNRPTNLVTANGLKLTRTFDNLNRLLTNSWPDGGMEKYFYSTRGLTNYTDPLTNQIQFNYDVAGRLIGRIFMDSTGTQVRTNGFEYKPAGDLVKLYDGKGQPTTWNYDEYGRVTNKVDAAGTNVFTYQYDKDNRVTNRIDALGRSTKYGYDGMGNLTGVDYQSGTDLSFGYDKLNRLTNMTDAVGATVFIYDINGMLQSENGPWSLDDVTYGYFTDPLRRSLGVSQHYASAWVQTYSYDLAGRLTNSVSPAGTFGYEHKVGQASSLPIRLTLPGGSVITNAYDALGQLTSTYLRSSTGTNLNSHSYDYNIGGQRKKQTFKDGNYLDYTYDTLGQLKTALGKESGGSTARAQEQFTYTYDPAGNLTNRLQNVLTNVFNVNNVNELTTISRTGTLTVAGTTGAQATNVTVNSQNATRYADNTFVKEGLSLSDGTNAFTAIAQDGLGRTDTNTVSVYLPATASFAYDAKGNLTSDGRRGFEYDDENQLVSVTLTNAWQSKFAYDGLGRRRVRTELNWNGSAFVTNAVVRYVYDGLLIVQERDGNNTPLVTYTRGIDLSGGLQSAGGIGGLLARSDNTRPSGSQVYYHADGNGNLTAMVNDKQAVLARYQYDPFGSILSMSGPLAEANTYRFSSQEHHQPSGLNLYLFRPYDANLQRFFNHDPIGELGGVNLYGFVRNDPINRIDPFGLDDNSQYSAGAMRGQMLGQSDIEAYWCEAAHTAVKVAKEVSELHPANTFSVVVFKQKVHGADVGTGEQVVTGVLAGAPFWSRCAKWIKGLVVAEKVAVAYKARGGVIALGRFGEHKQALEALAEKYQARILDQPIPQGVVLERALQAEIDAAEKIIFRMKDVKPGSVSYDIELRYILSKPELIRKTTFIY